MLSLLIAGLQSGLTYSAIEVVPDPIEAGMNSHGLVAGIHRTGQDQTEAFVWKDGKVIWHSPKYTMMAGPNERGQVAFGSDKGLFLWQKGKIAHCHDVKSSAGMLQIKVPSKIVGIDEEGRIIAVADGLDNAYTILTWPRTPSVVKAGDGGMPFGFKPRALQGKVVAGTSVYPFSPAPQVPKGTCFVRVAGQTTTIGDAQLRPIPTAVSPDGAVVGYMTSDRRPFVWRAGTIVSLPVPDSTARDHQSIGRALGISKKGDIVGFADWQIKTTRGLATDTANFHRGCIWRKGQFIDLTPLIHSDFAWEVEEAWQIDKGETVLAVGRKSRLSSDSLLILKAYLS